MFFLFRDQAQLLFHFELVATYCNEENAKKLVLKLRLGQPADFVLGKTVAFEIFIVHKNAIAFIVSLR